MEAKELRIGNYIKKEGEVFQCSSYTMVMVERDNSGYERIPLTEEWLVKLGLYLEMPPLGAIWSVYRIDKYSVRCVRDQWEFLITEKAKLPQDIIEIKIQYVHQLQNLYFALTGKEL